MKKYIVSFLFCLFFSNNLLAQDFEIKKFVLMEKDQTAVTSPRKDLNGNTCGLVKVALKEAGAEFEGNVMGDVQFTGSEYLVYMPNGTKRLGIKHPDYLPTTIVFADYGTKRIVSGTTYQLTLKTNKKAAKVDNSKKGMAVFNIKPSNAMLMIDGQIADGSGGAYTLALPYGTHYYTVKLKDFSLNNQTMRVDKNAKTINLNLTEFFAKMDVSCKTEDAEISVNGEQKGIGKWNDMVAPGKYTIEASKDGCHSQIRQIELKDNDTLAVDFDALKTITGSLRVDYEPAGSDVLLNGKKVGVTPLMLKELPVGDYQIEIWKEYYIKHFSKIKIREDQEWKESGDLKLTEYGEIVRGIDLIGSEGSNNNIYNDLLAHYYRFGYVWRIDTDDQNVLTTCANDSVIVPFNPVKAISIFRQSYLKNKEETDYDVYDVENLGPCFPSEKDDAILSFCWAKDALTKYENSEESEVLYSCPYAALAWHYFYGIGCEKNIDEAKRYIREACWDGKSYPAYQELIRDMGLSQELPIGESMPL